MRVVQCSDHDYEQAVQNSYLLKPTTSPTAHLLAPLENIFTIILEHGTAAY